MKKTVLILLTNLWLLSNAQNFKDKIITLKDDTINCKITLVDNNSVFYDVEIKNIIRNKSIFLVQIKSFIIDKDSKPEVLFSKLKKQIDKNSTMYEIDNNLRDILISDEIASKNIIIKKCGIELKKFTSIYNTGTFFGLLGTALIFVVPVTPFIGGGIALIGFVTILIAHQKINSAGEYLLESVK